MKDNHNEILKEIFSIGSNTYEINLNALTRSGIEKVKKSYVVGIE